DDAHQLAAGTHRRAYDHLGAHREHRDGEDGIAFAVWAPNARQVSVIGDFNGWNAEAHPLEVWPEIGIWHGFVPGAGVGARYKYSSPDASGRRVEKAGPYAFQAELRPRTASIIADRDSYEWSDAEWIASRAERQAYDQPMAIYEVH